MHLATKSDSSWLRGFLIYHRGSGSEVALRREHVIPRRLEVIGAGDAHHADIRDIVFARGQDEAVRRGITCRTVLDDRPRQVEEVVDREVELDRFWCIP